LMELYHANVLGPMMNLTVSLNFSYTNILALAKTVP